MEDMIEMKHKNLYREGEIKKSRKGGDSKVCDLAKEIEEIREKLNRKVSKGNKILTSAEILELSQKLDKLIVKYIKNI